QAHEQIAVVRDHVAQDLIGRTAERTAQARDADLVRAERARDLRVVASVIEPRREQALAQLVPFELIRGEDRDEVVDVGGRRDERGERLAAVPAQRAAATARAYGLPAIDRKARGGELQDALPEHDAPDPRHAVRKAGSAV